MSTEPIWIRREPGARTTSVSRDQIAAAAIRLADREGIKAISMRRLAQDLGVGTMTLYHYVRTKDELFALMDDAMMGDLLVDDAALEVAGWREALTMIAVQSHEAQRRHPWIIDASGGLGHRIGPNGMRHFEQSVAATAKLDLAAEDRLDLISFVDDYVFGFSAHTAAGQQAADTGDFDDLKEYVEAQLDSGDFPHIESLISPGESRGATWERFEAMDRDESRFLRGLERMLDGLALDLERRGLA